MPQNTAHPSKGDQLRARLAPDAPRTMTKEQADRLRPVMTKGLATAALNAACAGYYKSGNPLYVLDGLDTAQRARIPLPNWIRDALRVTTAANGMPTLDVAPGLVRKKGQPTWKTVRTQAGLDERLKWLIEERPGVVRQLAADPRPKWFLDEYQELLKIKTKVSGADGAAEHALALLHQEALQRKEAPRYADVESLIQRYKTIRKARPAR